MLFGNSASNYESGSDDNDHDSDDVALRSASSAGICVPLRQLSSPSPRPVACANGSQSNSVHDDPKRRLENSDVHPTKKICQGISTGIPNDTIVDVESWPSVKINAVRI